MAINLITDPDIGGRITEPSQEYPFGSIRQNSIDGTPFSKGRSNDILGFQQALFRASNQVPSGVPDNAINSQQMTAIVEVAAGRAINFDDVGTTQNAYVLNAREGQHTPASCFDGLTLRFIPLQKNKGASTVYTDFGGTVFIKDESVNDLTYGQIVESQPVTLVFSAQHNCFILQKDKVALFGQKGLPITYFKSFSELADDQDRRIPFVFIYELYAENTSSGGAFYFDQNMDKSSANGGTILDVSVSINVQGSGTGNGCYIRCEQDIVKPEWFGAYGDGVTDDTIAFQKSVLLAESLTLKIALRSVIYNLTDTINIQRPLSIIGTYPSAYEYSVYNNGTGGGTWLYFKHSSAGLYIKGNQVTGSVYLDKFGTFRDQPAPPSSFMYGVEWAPNSHDADIYFDGNTDLIIGDLMLLNPTVGIKGRGGIFGRLTIHNLRGQPLKTGIDLDEQFESPTINMVRFWPYWNNDISILDYMIKNLDCLYFKRVDHPTINQMFSTSQRSGIRIGGNSEHGNTNKLMAGNLDFYYTKYGIWVDNSTITDFTAQIGNLTILCTNSPGSKGIFIESDTNNMQIGNLEIRQANTNCIDITGQYNFLSCSSFKSVNYDRAGQNNACIQVGSDNEVQISNMPIFVGSGNVKYAGSGRIGVDDWLPLSFTQIESGSGNLITNFTNSSKYKRIGRTVYVCIDIIINNTNGATGAIIVTTPTKSSGIHNFSGRNITNGSSLVGDMLSSTAKISIHRFDNGDAGYNGARLTLSGFYEEMI